MKHRAVIVALSALFVLCITGGLLAMFRKPQDPAQKIEWVDPIVKQIIYTAYLGNSRYTDQYLDFINENLDALQATWDTTKDFDVYSKLIYDYMEKNHITITESFLNNIKQITIWQHSQNMTVELYFHDESLNGNHMADGFPHELKIKSVADFVHLPNLEILELRNTSVTDLNPLAELTKLKTLQIDSPKVVDISPLLNLPKLTTLELDTSALLDFSVLGQFSNLSQLGLTNVNDFDISFLSHLTKLEGFGLYKGSNINLAEISKHIPKNLSKLSLNACELRDITDLSGLNQLEMLSIDHNNISDLSPLSRFTRLKELSSNFSHIIDGAPLAGLSELEKLSVEGNHISDLSFVSELENLKELNISYNNLSDLSLLDDLPNLESALTSGNFCEPWAQKRTR